MQTLVYLALSFWTQYYMNVEADTLHSSVDITTLMQFLKF